MYKNITAAFLFAALLGCDGSSTRIADNTATNERQQLAEPDTDDTSRAIAAGFIQLPATIEAENFVAQSSIGIGQTTDTGGSDFIGWIENGDYTEYTINAPLTGSYRLEARVASENQTAEIEFTVNDTVTGVVTVAPSNDWDSWTTVSTELQLAAGNQNIRLKYTGSAGPELLHINWFSLAPIIDESAPPTAGPDTDEPNPSDPIGGDLEPGELDNSDWIAFSDTNTDDAFLAIDNIDRTLWSTQTTQTRPHDFTIDMRERKAFNEIILVTTQTPAEYPRSYEVSVSDNNTDWIEVAAGTGAINGPTVIRFAAQNTRYIKISQLALTSRVAWSIHELSVYDRPADETSDHLELNLRVHIMQGGTWLHETGQLMESWVTENDIMNSVFPEMNQIWSQAGIKWIAEQIIIEPIAEDTGFQDKIDFIVTTARDSEGRSDPDRLPRLYDLMQPDNRSLDSELGSNLFHIYIFPFIGNTSQGNAMRSFGSHSVVGSWSNKHNGGRVPETTLLTEDQANFERGSLARTIAHELGHVLTLSHDCRNCLMDAQGYLLEDDQIDDSQQEAINRIK